MGAKARILLADHHLESRDGLSEALKSAGYLVEVTASADEFLAATRQNRHELILLDDSLPELDCLDACRRIKEYSMLRACQGPSVLMLSGEDNAGPSFEPTGGDRADAFISRSVVDKELVATVDSMIRLRSTENSLAKQDLYRQLIDNLNQGIWAVDREGYTTFMNDRMAEMLMITADASLGRHLFDFMDERGIEICKKNIERREQGIREDHDFELLRADGSRIHTIMQTSPVTNPAGEYIGALAGVLDITDRVRREKTNLQRAVTQFRQLLESAPDAVVVADMNGRITLVNACTEKLFGYSRGELLGQDTDFLIPVEQRIAHRQIRRRFAKNQGPRIVGEGYEMSGLRKDGTVFPAEVNLSPLHTEEGLQFVSTIRDITRRKAVEKNIQANLSAQKVIGSILHLSLEDIALEDILQQTLEMILDLPWLSLLNKGAVFLVGDEPDVLVMKAQVQLPDALLNMCARVKLGHCLCGQAAATRKIVFADCIDEKHETVYEGRQPHGHYCIPIVNDDHLYGVINLYLQEGHLAQPNEDNFLKLVADALAGTIQRKQAEHTVRENESQLLAAQSIQEHILPDAPPHFPGLQIAGAYQPAEFAAGDHYDHFIMPDGTLGFGIGDVSGHGFSSALIMASTHAYIHSLSSMGFGLSQVFKHANINLNRETDVGQFVTATMGRIDPVTRELNYVSAGHPTGYVLDSQGEIKGELTSTGVPLAVLPNGEYPEGKPVFLENGDTVVLLTDGVLEAMAPDEEFFGEERTLAVVRKNVGESADLIVEAIIQAVTEFRGNQRQDDDITALVIKAVDQG
jgi:PAS domain S-box-containing protein